MSILEQLASAHNRRDEELNQQVAESLCNRSDHNTVQENIQELVDNLNNKSKHIRSDCIKVLYEIGAVRPGLIDLYVDEFIALLSHKDNRMIWGAMAALGSIAAQKAEEIWECVDKIIDTSENGSIITQDGGIRVLATLSAEKESYAEHIYPFIIRLLEQCKPKDVPRHAESILIATKTDTQRAKLRHVLEQHVPNLNPSQLKRVNKILKNL